MFFEGERFFSNSAALQLDLGEAGLIVSLVRNLKSRLVQVGVVHPETRTRAGIWSALEICASDLISSMDVCCAAHSNHLMSSICSVNTIRQIVLYIQDNFQR
jgi:hypothetical protein